MEKENTMLMHRQGDLLFIKIDKEPKGIIQNSKDILKSSVTGHSHKLTEGVIYVNEDVSWENKGNFYLKIPCGGSKVIHEEHKEIPLEEGIWEVRRQREVNGYVKD